MPTESDAPGDEPNLELNFGFGRKKKRRRKAPDAAPQTAPDGSSQTSESAEPAAPAPPAAPAAPAASTPPAAPQAPGAPPARPAARPPARPPSRPITAPGTASAPVPPAAPRPAAARPPTPSVHPPTSPVGSAAESGMTPPDAPHGESPIDPLDAAEAALDEGPSRRARRKEARSETRARRRAEKQARKDAERATREEAALADTHTTAAEHVPVEAAELEESTEYDEDEGPRLAATDGLVARLPAIHPLAAAIITGALSGLAAVGLAFGAANGCDSLRGTDSCGGTIGLLALVAILAIEVLIGANLLKAWQISDPFSTSFLGIGLVATLAMLIFLDDLDSSWMLLVIPLMTAVAFALSWWVTVRFIDEYEMASEVDSELGEPDFPDDPGPVPSQEESQRRDSNA